MNLEPEYLSQMLINQWGYKTTQVNEVVSKLLAMPVDVLRSFQAWVATGDMPDEPIVSGYTPKRIYDTFHLKPPASFLLLDWIRREPKEALRALADEFGKLPPSVTSDPMKSDSEHSQRSE